MHSTYGIYVKSQKNKYIGAPAGSVKRISKAFVSGAFLIESLQMWNTCLCGRQLPDFKVHAGEESKLEAMKNDIVGIFTLHMHTISQAVCWVSISSSHGPKLRHLRPGAGYLGRDRHSGLW